MSILCWNLAIRRASAGAFIKTASAHRSFGLPLRPPRHLSPRRAFSSTSFRSRLFSSSSSVAQVTKDSIDWLQARNVPEPEASVHQLLAHALNLPWSNGFNQIRTNDATVRDRMVTEDESAAFQTLLDRRATLEPLQYILGKWDFLDYTLHIQSPLLCPRPETEELVLHVERDAVGMMKEIASSGSDETATTFRILDIGCGTGAIGIALADRLSLPAWRTQVTAIDVEPTAVQVSNRNAKAIIGEDSGGNSGNSRYEAILCNVADFNMEGDNKFDLIVSNPPYIPQSDMATLSEDVVNFESHTALCGGNDGLDVIRTIIAKMPEWMGSGCSCWMEVDPTHPALLQEMLQDDPKVAFDSKFQDMFGRDRFVKLVVR